MCHVEGKAEYASACFSNSNVYIKISSTISKIPSKMSRLSIWTYLLNILAQNPNSCIFSVLSEHILAYFFLLAGFYRLIFYVLTWTNFR